MEDKMANENFKGDEESAAEEEGRGSTGNAYIPRNVYVNVVVVAQRG
jgi:formylmethanofuran dehydrogenase subunit D